MSVQSSRVVVSIDAGTTGVTVFVIDETGREVSRGYAEFPQYFPQPGWVEHDAEEIWGAVNAAGQAAVAAAGDVDIVAVGITNQRETVVVWERTTGRPVRRAIVWQDRRTAQMCQSLTDAGHGAKVESLTGLRLDPYFSASKIAWLAECDQPVWSGIHDGSLAVGTVDSFLVSRLSGGVHVTDPSNACRTLLCDIDSGTWSPELLELFGVPQSALPEIVPSWGETAKTGADCFVGEGIPISGIAGDQQAALFGQACWEPGMSKCTYGTGAFVLTNEGGSRPGAVGDTGLLTSIAWSSPAGEVTYASEGAVFVCGSAVQWLRDGLQLFDEAADIEALANRAGGDSGGVVFVPALTGLGAPWWNPQARGMVVGLTRGTDRSHVARATLEAMSFQVLDVVSAAAQSLGVLRVDGGASRNNLLMQLQADVLGVPVERPVNAETTAWGAAMLAGLGVGLWSDREELASVWQLDQRFEPSDGSGLEGHYQRWLRAVELCRQWQD